MNAPVVPSDILDAIRAHQRSAIRPEREIVGRIVVRGGVAVRYDRLRNWAKGDGKFSISVDAAYRGINRDEEVILLHSHPYGRSWPSDGDLNGAHSHWLGRPYAIYVVTSDWLRMFSLHFDRKGWDVLPFRDRRSLKEVLGMATITASVRIFNADASDVERIRDGLVRTLVIGGRHDGNIRIEVVSTRESDGATVTERTDEEVRLEG